MKSSPKTKLSITQICLCCLLATVSAFADEIKNPAIIPEPQKMTLQPGTFTLTSGTSIYSDSASRPTVKFLTERLRPSTGYPLKTHREFFNNAAVPGAILLTTKNADTHLGPEGYELTVSSNSVVIRAPTQTGMFYGVQTLFQLLPTEIFSTNLVGHMVWQIPCVQIEDWPRFQWRGFMLDVSRHFFNKSEVETFLDAMALHKMNVFHWHLTDDQGWRIQIKKYPKLTQIGAWRPGVGFGFPSNSTTAYGPDGRYGGFYTQDDIREVVKYAAARHITIVPEIEMPGHATAALAAYPQYSCTGGPFEPPMTNGVFNGIYDPAKEGTFVFLSNVLAEVSQLFPGKYIHIGGDEVPKETWHNSADCQALMKREGLKNEEELQSWFVRRIEKIINTDGHSMIGWSEILQGGLAKNAAVMDWIGGAKEAASAGHNVVMTPTSYCYFDFYQSTNRTDEPRAAGWGRPLTLSKMYAFDPMPTNVPPQLQKYILGAQGNLWTEWIPNLKHAEYMTFPRACALAEDTWSAKNTKNWDDFMRRLQIHVRRLGELDINYRHASVDVPKPDPLK
jgi:hexosaminidase